ncbi:hypothetical protein IM817_12330 [Serratia marcescens]|uniref:hypothetical protein n=1 Tax=Serratia marcescens TaxID=615 RepID=UPI001C569E22|nr:hypothetical protein [Serratia marcescens]QXX98904.1 hypothetical protein IM817_12330 [Serratia marcescens]
MNTVSDERAFARTRAAGQHDAAQFVRHTEFLSCGRAMGENSDKDEQAEENGG